MADTKQQSIEDVQQEIVDLKIRLKRIEEYLLDALPLVDPRDYIHGTDDEELAEAVRIVTQFNTASASFLQRKMSISYTEAARLLDRLEAKGVVSPGEGAKPRDVLLHNVANEYVSKEEEEHFDAAVKIVLQLKTVSAASLQKTMDIGYARASRLLDQMEEKGIVSPAEGAKPRKVLGWKTGKAKR
jgi:DNA segregation ATPase FtsK/SpoIIIE-like protein